MPEDYLLSKKIRKGDIKVFEMLFKHYYEALCRYSMAYVGAVEEAEEIVQELFYRIWKNREDFEISFSIKAYLYGAVRNNSLQYLEHQQVKQNYKEQIIMSDNSKYISLEEELEYKELIERIDKALNKLPKRQQEIFVMSKYNGLKHKEIAEKLNLSVKTIEAEMTKTLKELRKQNFE